MQKDLALLRKQEETVRLVKDSDGNEERLHDKPANNHANSRPTFHRPFLDVEDGSPPEKLCKLSGSAVQNGICAMPVHMGSLPAVVQKTPLCPSASKSHRNIAEDSGLCEAGKLELDDEQQRLCEGDCHELRDEDGGRLNAALGLISLADVSSDAAQIQPALSLQTTAAESSNGWILFEPFQCSDFSPFNE